MRKQENSFKIKKCKNFHNKIKQKSNNNFEGEKNEKKPKKIIYCFYFMRFS